MSFQSPSLRGSGRFRGQRLENQLESLVSIPFIAGQWSLRGIGETPRRRCVEVSIPFIAGQWSLREIAARALPVKGAVSQSPSLRGSGRFCAWACSWTTPAGCLNPLHCGAVVASHHRPDAGRRVRVVSIPFIAGQWSLRRCNGRGGTVGGGSQSPSLRGSGRFSARFRRWSPRGPRSQSPSLRGSGRFPFSLPEIPVLSFLSQSPSLRGSGRFAWCAQQWLQRQVCVSIPFIAGQWSLHNASVH